VGQLRAPLQHRHAGHPLTKEDSSSPAPPPRTLSSPLETADRVPTPIVGVSPLRIGILCHGVLGGSARAATRLAAALSRRGHRVHLFVPGALPWLLPDSVVQHRIPVPLSGYGSDPGAAWRCRDVLCFRRAVQTVTRDAALEILHFHYALPFALIADQIAGELDGAGVLAPGIVGTLHGSDVTRAAEMGSLRSRLRQAFASTAALTTVSHAYARLAADVFGLVRPPQVIPNFLGAGECRPIVLSRGEHAARLRRPRLIHVSNFRPVKAPAAVARVFARVRERVDAELGLVGDGPEMPSVRRLLDDPALAAHVRYHGVRQDVSPLLADADLLVLTSRMESFGLAALEAMACGLPVVAPRVGGVPEVVEDGVSGLLFAPEDERDALDKVLAALRSSTVHWSMRCNAIARARHFSEPLVVERYEALYRQVVSRREAHAAPRASHCPAALGREARG
jgi:L-malate glycosyltransferase